MSDSTTLFHERKVLALRLIERHGVKAAASQPVLFRALWWLGLDVPPPHFAPFSVVAFIHGAGFAAVWALFLGIFVWPSQPTPWPMQAALALCGGSMVGMATAFGHRHAFAGCVLV